MNTAAMSTDGEADRSNSNSGLANVVGGAGDASAALPDGGSDADDDLGEFLKFL